MNYINDVIANVTDTLDNMPVIMVSVQGEQVNRMGVLHKRDILSLLQEIYRLRGLLSQCISLLKQGDAQKF